MSTNVSKKSQEKKLILQKLKQLPLSDQRVFLECLKLRLQHQRSSSKGKQEKKP